MTEQRQPLAGRTALITGAAKRLGRATALALAENGAAVIVHYNHSGPQATELAERIRRDGRSAWTIQGDLADTGRCLDIVAEAIDLAGGIDILINNASIFPADRITETRPADIERCVAVHATAPLLLSRTFARHAARGHIVNFLDAKMHEYDDAHASYHLSKRMLLTLTRMLAVELAPDIAVNAVAPGLVLPPEGKDESYLDTLADTNPLHTHGSADDIAHAVHYLLTSRFVTGQVMYVDGGRHMKGHTYG
ncbi:MAG: SDR family oxidoreductase [Planctomycetes bacterium]|nr:SDR family oxidoreductase [Planctomycetota bacterium]